MLVLCALKSITQLLNINFHPRNSIAKSSLLLYSNVSINVQVLIEWMKQTISMQEIYFLGSSLHRHAILLNLGMYALNLLVHFLYSALFLGITGYLGDMSDVFVVNPG